MMMTSVFPEDWASASETFDDLKKTISKSDELASANEAQTRFDVIDQIIRNVLGWQTGQVNVEEYSEGPKYGFVDYVLRVADATLVIEAKRAGATFPSPTGRGRLRLTGSVLGSGEIAEAIDQVKRYAWSKQANVACVSNGACWCFFSMDDLDEDSYATLLFPFSVDGHPELMFNALSEPSVRNGSVYRMSNRQPQTENRLISVLWDADGRVDRNNIADHIVPALNEALYADALTSNPESLKKCFVPTEARSKFDSLLGMHLADPKPSYVAPAERIKTGKKHGPIEKVVESRTFDHAPPVTLIIGPVGAGKSTYLKHFELISGEEILRVRGAHWIYVDFEEMGKRGNPRQFLYSRLRDYLLADHKTNPTDYKSLVEPAYEDEIAGLAKGPLAKIFNDKAEFNRRITDHIQRDFEELEPYVDKLFRYLAGQKLCVIVLDNSDLYEDEELETEVFTEGLALSKRLNTQVIVCLRDETFVRHRNSAAFDAYELRKLWLDPPPFRSVLSKRLTYSRRILEGQSTKILLANGMQLVVPDLGVFFEIVQRSVLSGSAGQYIESMSDLDIRRGLTLINNFITSGHIQADRALREYIDGDRRYTFPFHEVFKGTALGQWKHYKESRADCINLFDSRLGTKRTRLLRLAMLYHLGIKARHENTLEVAISECANLGAQLGASEGDVVNVLNFLKQHSLIRTVSADLIGNDEKVVITRSGGYYLVRLCRAFVYTEQCMHDTAIEDPGVWEQLCNLTEQIEASTSIPDRMVMRRKRIGVFMEYLLELERLMISETSEAAHVQLIGDITKNILDDADDAVSRARYWYGEQI
jgi:hypothetical protein